MTTKLSIITICKNCAANLDKTLRSIVCQDYNGPTELIVIDGGSTDNTISIINKYSSKITRWISEPDKGVYDAMNKGISISSGDWLCFMNAGDTFASPHSVSQSFHTSLLSNSVTSNTQVIYGDYIASFSNQQKLIKALPIKTLHWHMSFCHQSSFIKNRPDLHFDDSMKIAADYEVFRDLLKRYGESCFVYTDCPVAVFDMTGASNNNIVKQRQEYLTIYKNYNPHNLHYWTFWLVTKLHFNFRFGIANKI